MAPHRPQDPEERQAQSTSWSAVNYLLRSGFSWSGHERNNLFVNLRDGRFADVSHVGGVDFADDARGVAAVDWDSDGDVDLWLNNRSSPKARLMRNEQSSSRRSWRLRLIGTDSNRDAVGARATLRLADGRALVRTVRAGVNYTVQGTKWLHFGLGDDAVPVALDVRWPAGAETGVDVAATDGSFVLVEGENRLRAFSLPTASSRLEPDPFHVEPRPRTASVPLGRPLELPPDLAMTDFDGEVHTLADFAGEPVLINLWASWCAPCRTEFADFDEHRRALDRSGLSILACSVDEDPASAAEAARALGVRFPAGMCDAKLLGLIETLKKAVFDQYEDLLLPTSLLLDGEGRLARVYVGPANAVQLAEDVQALREAKTDLELLDLAAMTHGGRWERPEVWLASQKGKQLIQMTQFLSRENRGGLLPFYASALAEHLDRDGVPERALASASDALLEAGRTIVAEDPAAAAELLRRLLRHRPDDERIHWQLAWALLDAEGSSPEAQRAAEAALRLAPEPASPRQAAFRGLVLQRLGRAREALPALEQAAGARPDDETLAAALAAVRSELGRQDEQLRVLRARLAAAPDDPAAALALAQRLDSMGKSDEATEHYLTFVEESAPPSSPAERASLGRALFRLDRWDEAAEQLEGAVSAGENVEERRLLGLALARTGRDEEARGHLEASRQRLPPDSAADQVLGIVQARTGDLEAAIATFERVLDLQPGHREATRSLALAHDNLGQSEQAIEWFERHIANSPRDLEARHRLARNLEQARPMEEAIEAYRAILRLDPSEPSARYRLAWLLATNSASEYRDGGTALDIAKQLNEENPPHPALLDLLAAAYAETGRFDEALRIAAEAEELAETSGDAGLAEQIRLRRDLYAAERPFHGVS